MLGCVPQLHNILVKIQMQPNFTIERQFLAILFITDDKFVILAGRNSGAIDYRMFLH